MMTTEPLTNTELAEKRVQELAAALDYWRERAEAAEADASRLRLELMAANLDIEALAARVADLEAALGRLDALAPDYELPDGAAVAEAIASGYILTAGCRDIHGKVAGVAAVERNNEMLRARVADLEAQLAAQQWRPVTDEPLVAMQYQVVVQHSRQQPAADHMAYYPSSGWTGTDVIYWRPIPPLPPLPDAAEEPTP